MKIDVLTIFPEMFGAVKSSMLARGEDKGLLEIRLTDIRDYTVDKHKKTDDSPFGGGVGMVMTCDPIFRALRNTKANGKRLIYMSPKGKVLNQEKIEELSKEKSIVILCGHYEGVDQRVIDYWNMEEISIGDYVLTGGEPAAIVLIDAVARMIPGILSKVESVMGESIYSGLLESPQYTKPRSYEGMEVPEVLFGGHHEKIRQWQLEEALKTTKERRPDLFAAYCERTTEELSKADKNILKKVKDMV